MRLVLTLILSLGLFSCAKEIYIPNTRNVPLFQGAGEFQASAYLANGLDIQGGVAATDHIGIIGSYSLLNADRPEQDYVRKNRYGELGLGLYNATRTLRTELYAGYGLGKGTAYDQYYFFFDYFSQQAVVHTAKFSRIFIQPSVGTNNPKFNLAFSPRFSVVRFSEFTAYNPATSSYINISVDDLDEKPQLIIEPSLTSKFLLIGNLYGVFQLNVNMQTSEEIYFNYVKIQAIMGIQLHVGNQLRTRVY